MKRIPKKLGRNTHVHWMSSIMLLSWLLTACMMCTLMPSAFCANVNEPRAADVNVTVPSASMRHVCVSE